MIHNNKSKRNNNNQDNRPIKGSQNGKYNMNFIDPTNDICTFYDLSQKQQQLKQQQSQLKEHLQALLENYFQSVTFFQGQSPFIVNYNQKKTQKQLSEQIGETINIKKQKGIKKGYSFQCSVCLSFFKQGQMIKKLKCSHYFHKQCVLPWFKNNNKCPNCRFTIIGKPQDNQ